MIVFLALNIYIRYSKHVIMGVHVKRFYRSNYLPPKFLENYRVCFYGIKVYFFFKFLVI